MKKIRDFRDYASAPKKESESTQKGVESVTLKKKKSKEEEVVPSLTPLGSKTFLITLLCEYVGSVSAV